jgi:hypothetical protein
MAEEENIVQMVQWSVGVCIGKISRCLHVPQMSILRTLEQESMYPYYVQHLESGDYA